VKQFVPVCDEDWPEAVTAGLVLVPYQPGVRCFHALREPAADGSRRAEPLPTTATAIAGVFD